MARFRLFLFAAIVNLLFLPNTSGFISISRPRVSVKDFSWTLFSQGDKYTEYSEYKEYSDDGDDSSSSAIGRGRRRRPLRQSSVGTSTASQDQLDRQRREARKRHLEALKDPTLLTKVNFDDRTDMSPATKRAVTEVLGLERMTEIQTKTYAAALEGNNVLGRAKTGTGKTLAFLLPSIERLLQADLNLFKPGLTIGMIVVAPTRELAIQIAEQAEALLTFHKDMNVACCYGGTKIQRDVRLLSGPHLPAILVATPGRLLEHCETTRIGRRKFSDMAQETRIVVLDEADRLLDGFGKDTQRILSFLPRAEKRQTLLFSATISKKLREFVTGSLNIDFLEIDCLPDRNIGGQINLRVDQSYLVLQSITEYIPTLVSIIERARKEKDYKILVFFPASRLVRFFVQFFNIGLEIPVLEIHSRMSQASRTRASNTFRSSKNAILFSSDVSARGVDYPDISLVIQYGAPSSEDCYIHRIGRTGRAGSAGRGLLVLLPFERQQTDRMRKRGIRVAEPVLEDSSSVEKDEDMAKRIKATILRVRSGHAILTPNAKAACRAFLAYYVPNSGGLEPAGILKCAEEFAKSTGLLEMPTVESEIAARLGLEGLLKIE